MCLCIHLCESQHPSTERDTHTWCARIGMHETITKVSFMESRNSAKKKEKRGPRPTLRVVYVQVLFNVSLNLSIIAATLSRMHHIIHFASASVPSHDRSERNKVQAFFLSRIFSASQKQNNRRDVVSRVREAEYR